MFPSFNNFDFFFEKSRGWGRCLAYHTFVPADIRAYVFRSVELHQVLSRPSRMRDSRAGIPNAFRVSKNFKNIKLFQL